MGAPLGHREKADYPSSYFQWSLFFFFTMPFSSNRSSTRVLYSDPDAQKLRGKSLPEERYASYSISRSFPQDKGVVSFFFFLVIRLLSLWTAVGR